MGEKGGGRFLFLIYRGKFRTRPRTGGEKRENTKKEGKKARRICFLSKDMDRDVGGIRSGAEKFISSWKKGGQGEEPYGKRGGLMGGGGEGKGKSLSGSSKRAFSGLKRGKGYRGKGFGSNSGSHQGACGGITVREGGELVYRGGFGAQENVVRGSLM